jgi:cytoskeleton protein RodZ
MTEETGVADAADGVGDELARARAAQGLSIADIARQLKFASRQIEAMEQGRFEDLPSGTFARGMVRSYARLLKLDAEPLVGRMAARVTAPDNAGAVASTQRPIPITDNNRRSNRIYAALSIAILGVIAAVVFEWQRDNANAARLSFVPAAQAPVEPQRLSAVSPSASAVELKPADISAPAAVSEEPRAAPAPTPSPAPVAAGNRRITLKFEGPSWVEIRGRDGKAIMSQLNPAGTEKEVEGRPPFALIIGNAQRVQLSYDDRQIDLAPHVKVEVARFTLE